MLGGQTFNVGAHGLHVLDDGPGFLHRLSWNELAEEFSVASGYTARAIYFDDILVILTYLNESACPVPFEG